MSINVLIHHRTISGHIMAEPFF